MRNMKPTVRFNGFNDDWEQRKFNNCFDFPVSTNSLSRALLNYDEGEIKSVHYGDILIKYPAILNIKTDEIPYITDGKLEKYKSSLLKNGDLIFADAAEDETVGKTVEVSGITDESLVSGLHTIVARSKEKKAEFFLGYYINSDNYHRQLLRLMQGSKVSSISKGNLQKTIVSFPKDFEEQAKIGSLFQALDTLITLHQRKLDLLKEQKAALLQKMFPTGDAKQPEIRFNGFSGDWEEKKLGDVVQELCFKSVVEDEYDVLSSTTSGVEIRQGRVSGTSNVGYKIIKDGDLVLSPQNLWLGNINVNDIGYGLVSPSYKVFKFVGINSLFIKPQLRMLRMLKQYEDASTQGASIVRRNLDMDSFYLIRLYAPILLEEQQKIGSFFQQLDNLITAQETYVATLKQQKQALLQKMFV